jgi:tetratricopeptide (TPR) repeat protein
VNNVFYGGATAGGEGMSGTASTPPDVEAVIKIAEGTLKDVHENTEFLATLWKWTTIVAGILAAIIAAFGIKTIHDLRKAKDEALDVVKKANDSMSEMRTGVDKLSRDITANHVVMMNCQTAQRSIEKIEEERAKLGAGAATNADFLKHEESACREILNDLKEVLRDKNPQDPAVASFAYNLLGYAQSHLRQWSAAMESAKRSLGFRENNPSAQYNAACYAAQLHQVEACVKYLARAIELDQNFLTSAKTDNDLDPVRQSEGFVNLVGA